MNNKKDEKNAQHAVKEILLKQVPEADRSKWIKRRPSKAELNEKYRLVKR